MAEENNANADANAEANATEAQPKAAKGKASETNAQAKLVRVRAEHGRGVFVVGRDVDSIDGEYAIPGGTDFPLAQKDYEAAMEATRGGVPVLEDANNEETKGDE